MEQQRISADELAMKLVNSRKIMKKVDTGDYEKGNINETLLASNEPINPADDMPSPQPQQRKSPTKAIPSPSVEQINQSKLPDAIKRAMIENPIPQITLNDSLDMDVVNKAKRLMEQENSTATKPSSKQSVQVNSGDLERKLTPIIENIIRKTLDDIVDKKLNQILAAQQTAGLNENLLIKVGDSIFKGKITGVKSSK